MHQKRIERLRVRMDQVGLDGFLLMSPDNRRYLSGFTGTSGLILITRSNSFLFTDFRYVNQALNEATSYEIIKYQHTALNSVHDIVKRLGLKVIGFEGEHISYNQYLELSTIFSDIRLLSSKGLVEELRMVKDVNEINCLKEAARIADYAFNFILSRIKPGLTEREVAIDLEYQMAIQGASGPSFATIVASGKRSSLPHGVATEKKLQWGDFVTMDFGCIYNGYCSDMTRTIVIGEPNRKQIEIYDIVLEAQKLGLEMVRPGLGAMEIDQASRDYISSKGYGEYFGHGLGHSLGLNVHENPSLSAKDNTEILENMALTIEPGIYIPDWGGVRIEDLIVVSADGYENLTKSPKELIVL